ncbi:MAG: FixH family protein [Phenylobacterium sp.]
MTSAAIEPGFRIRGWHVLAAFIGFFAVVIAVDVGFVVMSIRSFPGQVSVTPYEDGLLYNRKLAQIAAQERLGWRAGAAAEPGIVVVEMRDRTGAPLGDLTLSGRLERPATEAGRIPLRFQETSPGRYVARPGRLDGAWDLTAVAQGPHGERFEAERRLSWR